MSFFLSRPPGNAVARAEGAESDRDNPDLDVAQTQLWTTPPAGRTPSRCAGSAAMSTVDFDPLGKDPLTRQRTDWRTTPRIFVNTLRSTDSDR